MHQQQGLQIAKLGNAEVAAHHGLHSFLPTDAHPCRGEEGESFYMLLVRSGFKNLLHVKRLEEKLLSFFIKPSKLCVRHKLQAVNDIGNQAAV